MGLLNWGSSEIVARCSTSERYFSCIEGKIDHSVIMVSINATTCSRLIVRSHDATRSSVKLSWCEVPVVNGRQDS